MLVNDSVLTIQLQGFTRGWSWDHVEIVTLNSGESMGMGGACRKWTWCQDSHKDCQEERGMQKLIPYHKAKGVRKKEHQREGSKTKDK